MARCILDWQHSFWWSKFLLYIWSVIFPSFLATIFQSPRLYQNTLELSMLKYTFSRLLYNFFMNNTPTNISNWPQFSFFNFFYLKYIFDFYKVHRLFWEFLAGCHDWNISSEIVGDLHPHGDIETLFEFYKTILLYVAQGCFLQPVSIRGSKPSRVTCP